MPDSRLYSARGHQPDRPRTEKDEPRPAQWLVRMDDVSFAYPNGTVALSHVDLEIGEREVVSVIGPSGCGKSTMVSVLAGLRQASGTVRWNSDVLNGLDLKRRKRIGVIFQRNTVMPWLNVERNIGFGLRYLNISRPERTERVESLLEMGGLSDFSASFPHALSGGMERRVALLAGFAMQPKLLILDEPFSALDEPTRVSLHQELLNLLARFDMSALLITHDIGEAVSLSDRVCVMSKRPATVASTVSVPLGGDRDVRSIRSTRQYQETYQGLWQQLWNEISEP